MPPRCLSERTESVVLYIVKCALAIYFLGISISILVKLYLNSEMKREFKFLAFKS